VTTSPEEIEARVDALAHQLQGEEFVTAVRRLADELGPEGQPMLQQILLERAADEEDFQKAVRRRFAEKGWMRRTYARLESSWRDDRADEIAAALEAGPDGEARLDAETARLRTDRGRAALVLDELSRHPNVDVRLWVPRAAREILDDGAERVLLGLTRDKDPDVRDAAVEELLALGPDTARKIIPDLRRRLHSKDVYEPVVAMWALAELKDRRSLPAIRRIAHASGPEHSFHARSAQIVCMALEERRDEIRAGLKAEDGQEIEWFAAAARIEGSEETLAALEDCAWNGSREHARRVCRSELSKLDTAE
jgi:hypothetical protein